MSARRIEYHEGASADVVSAVTWYRRRSPKAALDFIEALRRAADVIREAPERWPIGKNKTRRFLLCSPVIGRNGCVAHPIDPLRPKSPTSAAPPFAVFEGWAPST